MSIILILSLGSCEEGKNILSPHSENTGMYSPGANSMPSWDWVANQINPYDNYGKMHNEFILYYCKNSNYTGTNLIEFINDFMELRLEYLLSENPLELPTEQYAEYISMNSIDSIHYVTNTTYVAYSHSYMEELNNILAKWYTPSSVEATLCVNRIKELETMILSDPFLSLEKKTELLKRTSIARYSIPFWMYQLANNNTEFGIYCLNHLELNGVIAQASLFRGLGMEDNLFWLNFHELAYCAAVDANSFAAAELNSWSAAHTIWLNHLYDDE